MGQREWTARAGVALPALPHRRWSDAARSDGNSGEGQRAVIPARLPRPLACADARDGEHPLGCATPVDQRRTTATENPASREAPGPTISACEDPARGSRTFLVHRRGRMMQRCRAKYLSARQNFRTDVYVLTAS